MTAAYRLAPVFQSVLLDESALERVLSSSPGVASARMDADYLVESIPHWLYVGDTPLHLAAASLRGWAARLVLRHGADPNATNRRGAAAVVGWLPLPATRLARSLQSMSSELIE